MASQSEQPTEVIDLDEAKSTPTPIDHEKQLTDKEASDADEELGIVTMHMRNPVKGFKARRVIGRYLRQLGVVDVGRGQLAFAESNAGEIMAGIDKQIEETQDAEIRMNLIKCKLEANKQIIEIGQTNIK